MADDTPRPDIQLICNLVIHDRRGSVLLVRYGDDDERWWLPGADLEPYEHPDDACARLLVELALRGTPAPTLHHVESFRGRRGWHVMFNHAAPIDRAADDVSSGWFPANALPRTAHGTWERGVIARVLG